MAETISAEEQRSVQNLPSAALGSNIAQTGDMLLLARYGIAADECPPWWSYGRDAWLTEFAKRDSNDILAGTISTVVAKVATTGWYLEGPERTANVYRQVLQTRSEFLEGWSAFIQKLVHGYLTQDAGVTVERIRTSAGDRQGGCMGLATIDPRYYRYTGDPLYPIDYYPAMYKQGDDTTPVKMHRSQVIHLVDNPTTDARRRPIGYCAVSRSLTTARILALVSKYEYQRLSDLPPAGLLLVSNMTASNWKTMLESYRSESETQNNTVWQDIMVAFGLNPAAKIEADFIPFSQMPEHFDKRTITELSVYSFALGFRIDPREIWPVSAGPLGTATEANIQHVKARAKGPGLILSDIERGMNDGLTLPPTLQFRFDFQDDEEDQQAIDIKRSKASLVESMVTSGLMSAEQAQAWLVKEGVLEEEDVLGGVPAPPEPTDSNAVQKKPAEKPAASKKDTHIDESEKLKAALSARVDTGPRSRIYSSGRIVRLEKRPQLWPGVTQAPVAKAVSAAGKVVPRGKPLPPWPEDMPVEITAEDVARAISRWDREMPREYRGLLMAQTTEAAVVRGGEGSGFEDHAGRPGEVGGSVAREGGGVVASVLKYRPTELSLAAARIYVTKQIAEIADITDFTPEQIEERMKAYVDEALAHDLCVRRGFNGAENILTDERFKTQYETGTSHGTYNPDFRKEAEEVGLGYPKDVTDVERPIYGYFDTPEDMAQMYGHVQFVLNPDVKDRTTFTLNDSLHYFAEGQLVGTPTSDPGMESWDTTLYHIMTTGKCKPYVEAQIHGGVALSDVARIVIHVKSPIGIDDPRAYRIVELATSRGIPYEVVEGEDSGSGIFYTKSDVVPTTEEALPMPNTDELLAVAHDGELYLLTADKETGVLYNAISDTYSQEMPFQVFFKWGNFEAVDPPLTVEQIKATAEAADALELGA